MEEKSKAEQQVSAEFLDPVPEDIHRELTSRDWVLEPGDDTKGQGWKAGLGQTEDDVEGQGIRWNGLRPADDDTEGHATKFGGLGNTEEDVEGQGAKFGLQPTDEGDDVYGLTSKYGGIGNTEEDVKGQVYRVRISGQSGGNPNDTVGQGWKAGLQTTEDPPVRIRFQPSEAPDPGIGHPQ